jgi:1-acyl-sn-glycerol-3-phosphate acyltransferase
MTPLRSLLFNVFFFGWTALVGLACLPVLLLPWRRVNAFGRWWSGTILAGLSVICGLKGEYRGLERLPAGACIVAMKHQSAWDTLAAPRFLAAPAFVLKQELMRIPVFGWYLARCRMLPVDRKGGGKALKEMVAAAQARAAEGRPIVIYPEGTRRAPGDPPAYHPGVAALYLALDLPVVPVALNSGLFWRRQAFAKNPGTITLEVQEIIPTGLDRRTFMRTLQERIETASRRLAETAAPHA